MARIDVTGLGEYIREQRTAAELSLRQLATNAGVSNPYLSQVERGLRNPSAEILGQIAKALAISAESLYIKAGILEEREGDLSVTTSLMADETLTERQRRVLLEIYAAFQSENKSGNKAVPEQAQPITAPVGNAQASAAPVTTAPKATKPVARASHTANRVENDGKSTRVAPARKAAGSSPRLATSGKSATAGTPVDAAS